jgi:hypothetical protein
VNNFDKVKSGILSPKRQDRFYIVKRFNYLWSNDTQKKLKEKTLSKQEDG